MRPRSTDDQLDALYDANYAAVVGRMLMDANNVRTLTYQLWAAFTTSSASATALLISVNALSTFVTGKMEETFNVSRY